ncbi:CheR-type MCP methyltransferase [Paraburkholderia caballeronis]|nr:CheR-type MCP methyltransferase [Paraburkholderia caballeronis]
MPSAPLDPTRRMRELRMLIERRVGLVIHEHQIEALTRAANDTCRRFGHADLAALLAALSSASDSAPVFEHLVAQITVGESHFFRDDAQMAFLEREFLPGLIAARCAGSRTLRVWSAAASDGQELYSIAIMLRELIEHPEAWNLHLHGTDLNTEALQRATVGSYSPWSLRGLDETRRRLHFGPPGPDGRIRLLPQVRNMARFSYLNLAADTFPSLLNELHAMDLILCRNVFIYFDAQRVREILRRLVDTLAPGGVLLLGASDLVDLHVPGLDTELRPGTCFYRKRAAGSADPGTRHPTPCVQRVSHAPAFAPVRQPPVFDDATGAGRRSVAARPALTRAGTHALSAEPRPASAAAPRVDGSIANLRALEGGGRWQDIVAIAERDPAQLGAQAESALAAARAFGSVGRQDDAQRWCERALSLAPTDANAHFLHALLEQEAGHLERALAAFRRALFLQPDFVLAHYQYGLLLLGSGRRERGLRSLQTVRRLVAHAPADRELQGAEHLSYGRMAQIIDNELSIHHES